MKFLFYFAFVMGCLFPACSHADTRTKKVTYTTIGNLECSIWIKRRKESISDTTHSITDSWFVEGWVLGSVSTLNAIQQGSPDILHAIDAETIYSWMDKYCAEHPKSDLLDASFTLATKLNNISSRKNARNAQTGKRAQNAP